MSFTIIVFCIALATGGFLLALYCRRLLQTVHLLRVSEQQYRGLFDRCVDVWYQTDRHGRITLISPSVKKVFGLTPEELTGKLITDFYREPALREIFLKDLRSAGAIDNFEAEIRRKDGTFVSISTNAVVRTRENGLFDGVEGICRDISRIKDIQKKQFLLEEELRHNRKMDAIGTLAGGIAHDFNNILTAIIGFAEMAQQKVSSSDPIAGDIAGILRSGMRAKELVRHILIFSRKSTYEPTPVDLHLGIKEALRLIRATLPETIAIKEHYRYRYGKVLADPTEIHQVIMNLCSNASLAMEEQGGTLAVHLDREELSGNALPTEYRMESGSYLRLRVSDTGKGIPDELIERVFEPFFTTRETGKGSGLGLAIVHGIVRRLGGMISIESSPESGTTVTVYLPEAATEKNKPSAKIPDALTGTERILFVDDEQVVTDVTCKGLELLGYRVTAFTGSEAALEYFRQHPEEFDLVITDQTMPKLSGGKLAEEILRIRPELPVIMCTGYSAIMDAEKAGEIGIRAFVMKPFDHKNIAEIVRKVLSENEVTEE